MNRSVRFLFGPVPVPAVRFLVPVPPVLVLTGAGSGLRVRTAALLRVGAPAKRFKDVRTCVIRDRQIFPWRRKEQYLSWTL